MTVEIVRTLRATLLDPTANKQAKLRRLAETYREALCECQRASCRTTSETNSIVTPYALPYQVKDALKAYVPTISEADSVGSDPPIRFVNRAGRFDREYDRTNEFAWRVPQPGRGTDFWVPLSINPDDESRWDDLVNDKKRPGDLQLLNAGNQWRLHVAISRTVQVREIRETSTPIGIDIGEQALLTACAIDDGTPTRPIIVGGAEAKRFRKELFTTIRRRAAEWRIEERRRKFQNALTDIVERASRSTIEYVEEFDEPVIVMEDLAGIRDGLGKRDFLNRRLHSWAFSRIQGRIQDKAIEAGIPVRFVSPVHSSITCHACGSTGERPDRATFKCFTESCHITEFQSDINAAVNIAIRADLGGETGRLKPGWNDSPRDGSAGDSATGCQLTD